MEMLSTGNTAGIGKTALGGLGIAGMSYGQQAGGSGGILAGIIGGAITGAMATPATPWIGGIIGGVIGGAMAAMGGGDETPETSFRIGAPQGTAAGYLQTRGHQGVSSQQNYAFVREQTAAYTQAERGYRDLLSLLGMDRDALVGLPTYDTGGFTQGTIDQIRDYFRHEWLPEAMRVAFWEPLSEGFRGLGMDQTAIDSLDRELRALPGANQFDQLSMFVGNVSALLETSADMDWNAILSSARETSMGSFIGGLSNMREGIGSALAGLDSMSLLQQAELAGSINTMMLSARQAEVQMLRQIDAAQQSVNRSLDLQIESLTMGGMGPQGQVSYVNQQIQSIMSGLRSGSFDSPETLSQAMADLQRYSGMYANLAGDRLHEPNVFGGASIADWLISVLEEARGLSDAGFEAMRDTVREQNEALIAEMQRLIEAIMRFNDNFDEALSGGGVGGPGDDTDTSDLFNQTFNVLVNVYANVPLSASAQVSVEPTTAIS